MTREELFKLPERIRYKGKPCVEFKNYDPRNGYRRCPEGYVYESVWVHAIDHETSKETRIEIGGLCAMQSVEKMNMSEYLTNLRDTLMMLEMHEVNEGVSIDGIRFFHPHKDVRINRHVQPERDLSVVADHVEIEEAA